MLESPPDSAMDMNDTEAPIQNSLSKKLRHRRAVAQSFWRIWNLFWSIIYVRRKFGKCVSSIVSIALPNTVVRKSHLTFWLHVRSSPTKRMSLRLFSVRVVFGYSSTQGNLAFSLSVFGFPCMSVYLYFYNPHISYFTVLTYRRNLPPVIEENSK
jgi:hypothetical protein